MPTLLLSCGLQPEADELARLAESASWHLKWLTAIDSATRFHENAYAYYGDTVVGAALGRSSEIALIEPTFGLLLQIPSRYLQRHLEYTTLIEASGKTEPVFVKSANPYHRCLDSRVWMPGEILRQANELSLNLPVLIAEPVVWTVEYRIIVLERRVITFTPYVRHGVQAKVGERPQPPDDAEVAEILAGCHDFLTNISVPIPPACTMDVGLIEGRGWALVEFNPVWCSRLFNCNRRDMLPVLQRACLKRAQMNEADAHWVLDRWC